VDQQNGHLFSKEDLTAEVIARNIPFAWVEDFQSEKLHLETQLKYVLTDLAIIEAQVKVNPRQNHEHTHQNKKQLKNPCCIHNHDHKWDTCRQNPKNKEGDRKNQNNKNNHTRQGNENNERTCKECKCTERNGQKSCREQLKIKEAAAPELVASVATVAIIKLQKRKHYNLQQERVKEMHYKPRTCGFWFFKIIGE
jgi:hypothetical protein